MLRLKERGYDEYCDESMRNAIEVVPSRVSNLKKLTRLDLANNQISTISESISNLRTLKYLDLSNNKLNY